MVTYTNKLDVTPGGVPLTIHLKQYSSDFYLVFELFSRCGIFTPESGTTAILYCKKPDGKTYKRNATINNSTVTVLGNKQMTAIAGDCFLEFCLTTDNTKILYTSKFIIHVDRAALDIDSLSPLSDAFRYLNAAEQVNVAIANAALADEMASSVEELYEDIGYRIRFYNIQLLHKMYVYPGEDANYDTVPTHPTDPNHYSFVRWDPLPINVHSNLDCYPIWEREVE